MTRRVEPELLDGLPPDDSQAVASRKDLRRLNAWMGNARTLARSLHRCFPTGPPRCVVDLGAGDGSLMWRVARRLPPSWRGVRLVLLDQRNTVRGEAYEGLKSLGWRPQVVESDVLHWLRAPSAGDCDALMANLFLHHFSQAQLAELLELAAARTQAFIAVEPRRSAWGLALCRLLPLLGCNAITLHDAPVSVRSGFTGCDLSNLWPARAAESWSLLEGPAGLASHAFLASLRPL